MTDTVIPTPLLHHSVIMYSLIPQLVTNKIDNNPMIGELQAPAQLQPLQPSPKMTMTDLKVIYDQQHQHNRCLC